MQKGMDLIIGIDNNKKSLIRIEKFNMTSFDKGIYKFTDKMF